MTIVRKEFEIKVLTKSKNGGRIRINTASRDRDRDHVFPSGARVENYLKNPVVQWGHNYRDPWATVGRTTDLTITDEYIDAEFELRPAANEHDPQNIVQLLWEGGWVRTASIGFIPDAGKANTEGGMDFNGWELLEWSLVPIPANQDALRLAVKGLGDEPTDDIWEQAALDALTDPHLSKAALDERLLGIEKLRAQFTGTKNATATDERADPPAEGDNAQAEYRAWAKTLTVESAQGKQTLIAAFMRYGIDIPADAEQLTFDPYTGECVSSPHPDAGKTVHFKQVVFVPPLKYTHPEEGYADQVFAMTGRADVADAALIAGPGAEFWEVLTLSEMQITLDEAKGFRAGYAAGFEIDVLTERSIKRARRLTQRLAKAGRVLSKKNEEKIIAARDNLDDVLAQLEEQPDAEEQAAAPPRKEIPPVVNSEDESRLAESLSTFLSTLKGNLK